MSKPLLLQLSRDSIAEVFEATMMVKREELLKDYPVLNEPLSCFVSLYLKKKLRGSFGTVKPSKSLLEEIVFNAKSAAFQDSRFSPLTVSDYINCEIELSLLTPIQEMKYTDINSLNLHVENEDGLYICLGDKEATLLPQHRAQYGDFNEQIMQLLKDANISMIDMSKHPQIFKFQVEKQSDGPIVS